MYRTTCTNVNLEILDIPITAKKSKDEINISVETPRPVRQNFLLVCFSAGLYAIMVVRSGAESCGSLTCTRTIWSSVCTTSLNFLHLILRLRNCRARDAQDAHLFLNPWKSCAMVDSGFPILGSESTPRLPDSPVEPRVQTPGSNLPNFNFGGRIKPRNYEKEQELQEQRAFPEGWSWNSAGRNVLDGISVSPGLENERRGCDWTSVHLHTMSSNAKWTQVTNDQGQVYYMNEETRETSWTYPE